MKRALRRLDSVHQKLISTVSSLAPNVYFQRPAEGEWSVAEIVHHLCLVEDRVIKELESALMRPPQRVGFFRRLIPTAIVSVRLVRVKAPRAVNPLDAPPKDIGVENFSQTRNRLKSLCTTHESKRLRRLIFKHPFLGEMDGVATVAFVGYHEMRHYKQIREVLQKLRRHGNLKTHAENVQPSNTI